MAEHNEIKVFVGELHELHTKENYKKKKTSNVIFYTVTKPNCVCNIFVFTLSTLCCVLGCSPMHLD